MSENCTLPAGWQGIANVGCDMPLVLNAAPFVVVAIIGLAAAIFILRKIEEYL